MLNNSLTKNAALHAAKRNPDEEAPVTRQEFAALQAKVQALSEEVARMAQAATVVTVPTDPPNTPQFEQSPLETDVSYPTASEDFGDEGLDESPPLEGCSLRGWETAHSDLLRWSPVKLEEVTQPHDPVSPRSPSLKGTAAPPPPLCKTEANPAVSLGSGRDGGGQSTLTSLRMCSVKLEDCRQTQELNVKVEEEENRYGELIHAEVTSGLKQEADGEESQDSVLRRVRPCSDGGTSSSASREHEQYQEIQTGEGLYICIQCGTRFSNFEIFMEHNRTHASEKSFHCSTCGKNFPQAGRLKIHQRIHTGEKPYTCTQCGKSYTSLGGLKYHKITHTGEGPYHCTTCGKKFPAPGYLKIHQRIHTGERPYPCSHCGKTFSRFIQLTYHQRKHTGERPYHCPQCGKSFSQIGNLKVHQRIHTGEEESYHCTSCGKKFSESVDLRQHQILMHPVKKPYFCSLCGKSFIHPGYLERHQRTHTGEDH